MRLPARPTIYEINTAVWLERLGRERGRPLALDEVPGAEWDALAALPVDAVWLMGVWQRSPAGLAIARGRSGARRRLTAPRCPTCAPRTSSARRTACATTSSTSASAARRRWPRRARSSPAAGLGLILDYVPNHVAPDHPWTTRAPSACWPGPRTDLARDPGAFLRTAGRRRRAADATRTSRPWPDVVQLNAFAPQLREAVADDAGRRSPASATGCAATWRC